MAPAPDEESGAGVVGGEESGTHQCPSKATVYYGLTPTLI